MTDKANEVFEKYCKDELLTALSLDVQFANVNLSADVANGTVRPSLQFGGSPSSSIGTKIREERIGVAMFQIFSKRGLGTQLVYQISSKIEGAFRNQSLTLQATLSGDGGGNPVDGANQKKRLLSGQIGFEEHNGPFMSHTDGEFNVYVLRIRFRSSAVYGIDT